MSSALFFFSLTIVASLTFVVIEILLLNHARKQKRSQFLAKEWNRVHRLVNNDPKHAVVEADKLLEYALCNQRPKKRKMSLGDALKRQGEKLFTDINGVWRVHKLRNRIVHELGFEITEKDANSALAVFKQALADVGVQFSHKK